MLQIKTFPGNSSAAPVLLSREWEWIANVSTGLFSIPGTEACIKVGGRLRVKRAF
jgi:hypothetical protein